MVSLNDSEELSSAASEDEEESSSDAPAEDSGSEVEIIEEVQGNGRQRAPLPLQPHSQFLSDLSEQDAAVLSLVNPEADLKVKQSYEILTHAYKCCVDLNTVGDCSLLFCDC